MSKQKRPVFFLILAGLVCMVSCAKKSKQVSDSQEKELPTEYNVLITGNSTDSTQKAFTINGHRVFFGEPFATGFLKNGYFNIQFDLKEPRIFDGYNVGGVFHRQNLFITPGDSVHVNIKNGTPYYTGKNAAHYNLNFSDTKFEWPIYRSDLLEYKAQCKKVYQRKQDFFDSYIVSNPKVSKEFENHMRSELKYEYLYHLMSPRVGLDGFNTAETIFTIGKAAIDGLGQDFVENDYFENVSTLDFNKPEFVNNLYFKKSFVKFIRYYFTNQDYHLFSKERFTKEKKFIQENFNGVLERFAICRLVYDYYRKSFPENVDNITQIKSTLSEYIPLLENESYLEEMKRVETNLSNFFNPIPPLIQKERVVDLKGQSQDLLELIESKKNKIIVIDFWASWCSPCIQEIKMSDGFRKQMELRYDVEWVYISIDEEPDKWKEKSNTLKDFGLMENQFLIPDVELSEIVDFFDLRDIPRYAIFSKDGMLVLNNAPRPSKNEVFEKILISLN
ncbi:MAG: TlpA disulfide reductase family protein [Bacteroidota bacterium]